ncbi:MAG: dephospho-CoA kinase [Chloroflexota bacterium]
MSHVPGKYIIGLTGNIATGKSVVRRMLEHLGAYTIDADSLSHRAIAKGAPGYQPVLKEFGRWLLDKEGEIDRSKLGRLVFSDNEALSQLEEIVHPLVRQATSMLIQRARQKVIVIEAIKLLESDLRLLCDSIWVTDSTQQVQVERLTRKRGLTREEANQRIMAQSAQQEKIAAANVVIRNGGSYEDLWKQVTLHWKKISPASDTVPLVQKTAAGKLEIQRGRPRDSKAIADLLNRLGNSQHTLTAEDIMASFGDKAYMLLRQDGRLAGLASWQVENLVARTTEVYLDENVEPQAGLKGLINEVERASRDLQCEASLIFLNEKMGAHAETWAKLGYDRRTPETLGVQAWQDAAFESMPSAGGPLYFKQLRQDRVLRPI